MVYDIKSTKLILVLIPVVIVFLIIYKSGKYDDAYFVPPQIEAGEGLIIPEKLAGWHIEKPQWFPEKRMFEKINGRDVLYKKYGVEGLLACSWIKDKDAWNMYLFVMKDYKAAKAVYLVERPENFAPLEKGDNSFSVPGAMTLHSGKYYIQLISLLPSYDQKSITELSEALIKYLPVEKTEGEEKTFKPENRLPGSHEFFSDNAFGFSSLKIVNAFGCVVEDSTATWFSADGGNNVIENYLTEFKEYGGKNVFREGNSAGGEIFENWEILFLQNGKIFGIRNAKSKDILLKHYNYFLKAR